MEWRLPYEASVRLQLHAEEGVGKAGEVVVVDAGVDEGGWKSDLADVILNGELLCPER